MHYMVISRGDWGGGGGGSDGGRVEGVRECKGRGEQMQTVSAYTNDQCISRGSYEKEERDAVAFLFKSSKARSSCS